VFGRIADGGAVFQDVHSKSAGSLLQILSHVGTSKLCMLLICMCGNTRLEARTAPDWGAGKPTAGTVIRCFCLFASWPQACVSVPAGLKHGPAFPGRMPMACSSGK